MNSWSGGYVSDIEYIPGFYAEQTPNHIQLACLLNGYNPPLHTSSFRYCELGCGQGTTASIIAAAYPHSKIVAVDFNPAQIARAKRNAIDCELHNLEFIELSFEELSARDNFEPFDIVSLHGVWSWISDENRRFIVEFLRKMVKSGGAVAVSYNSMPGWTSILPFQRLVLEHAMLSAERSDRKIIEGLKFIEHMQQAGCTAVGNTDSLNNFRSLDKTRTDAQQSAYLAHEYLNEKWKPMYFTDTSRLFEAAKLDFVASATLFDNFNDLMLTPDQKKIYDGFTQTSFRELIKDFFVNRPFRRDIFIKGAQKVSDFQRSKMLGNICLALVIPDSHFKYTLNVPAGTAALPRQIYESVYAHLSTGPKSVSFLLDQVKDIGHVSGVEIAGLLVGSGQAASIHFQDNVGLGKRNLFNRKAIEKVLQKEESIATLAVPKIGSGIKVNAIEAVIYNLLCSGVCTSNLKKETLALLLEGNSSLVIDGEVIADINKLQTTLADAYDWFYINKFNIWKNIGLIN